MARRLGWFNAPKHRASCSKRFKRSLSRETAVGRTLTATLRSNLVSRARYTSPIPPDPSNDWISYGPSFVPGLRAIGQTDYTWTVIPLVARRAVLDRRISTVPARSFHRRATDLFEISL